MLHLTYFFLKSFRNVTWPASPEGIALSTSYILEGCLDVYEEATFFGQIFFLIYFY